jgi:hypothetical protein
MRTLTEEICWVISPDRKYPLTIDKPRFYNSAIGHFYTDNTEAEYDEENVVLERCEIIRKAFRPVNKERILAPYALCGNDYDGCRLCNRHYQDPWCKPRKCPYVLGENKLWLEGKVSVIGFYKCYEGQYYERKSYNRLMVSSGISPKYLISKPNDHDDRMSTFNLSNDLIMNQGQTCDLDTFDIFLSLVGEPSYESFRYILGHETVYFLEKIKRMALVVSVDNLNKAIHDFGDNPQILKILRRVREFRRRK